MPHLLDSNLVKAFEQDRSWLAQTDLPIITVAGTFREDVKHFHGLPDNNSAHDLLLSRAHFSMALGVAMQAWHSEIKNWEEKKTVKLNRQKAWLADPTNFVSPDQWQKVELTEFVGKTIARHPILKLLKDLIDQFGRNKLPILESITPPLLYLTENVQRPILCFHIAAGNILAEHGKSVVQVVTDPQVRPEYLNQAANPKMRFCVFDDRTKLEFLELAALHEIKMDPERIIVTGPPVDPRIVHARTKKIAWRNGPLKLCLATGGLGTNKHEIEKVLQQILPQLRERPLRYELVVYAGTQLDIAKMTEELAKKEGIEVGAPDHSESPLRLLYHPQILDANEMLIRDVFPWADGFITKPSGDMAYDAVAAGCFLLTLGSWGPWEDRIREIFEQKDISRSAKTDHIIEQLQVLQSTESGMSWVERAMNRSFGIEKLFLMGAKKIVETATSPE